LEELAPIRVELVGEFAGIPNEVVHRHGAEARSVIGERDVAGALVDGDALVDVFAEERLGEKMFVRVVGFRAPGLDAVDPVIVLGFGLADAVVVHVTVGVVIGVKLPAEGELFDVVEAGNALSLFLRFTERRQEKPGEDRDNGDDDEELDKGERFRIQGAMSARARSSFQDGGRIQMPVVKGKKMEKL
jgi:hypothetical protein